LSTGTYNFKKLTKMKEICKLFVVDVFSQKKMNTKLHILVLQVVEL
jgi:hypothetical protein